MISTGTLMLGKALLTAAALLGFCIWQLRTLRRLRREREAARAAAVARRDDQADISDDAGATSSHHNPRKSSWTVVRVRPAWCPARHKEAE